MNESQRIYLDNAATTPVRPEVLDAMLPYFSQHGYNASSQHAEGRRARAALDDARDRVASIFGCKSREIVFCGSGTEADNLAVIGAARAARPRGRHVVANAIEHHAVLQALEVLRDEGFDVTLVPVDRDGVVQVDAFRASLRSDTVLAAVMYANNELGTIQPIPELAAVARERDVVFFSDAVQAAGALPLDVQALGVDLMSISAHKFSGPKGVGALFVRDGTALQPLVVGGGQERGRRSATENVAGIVGLSAALDLAAAEREEYVSRTAALRDRLETGLLQSLPKAEANGKAAARLPNISSVTIAGVASEPLLIALDLEGVAVSAGSACAAGAVEASHVLAAIGRPRFEEEATLRFSLGRTTTAAEIARVASLVPLLAHRAGVESHV